MARCEPNGRTSGRQRLTDFPQGSDFRDGSGTDPGTARWPTGVAAPSGTHAKLSACTKQGGWSSRLRVATTATRTRCSRGVVIRAFGGRWSKNRRVVSSVEPLPGASVRPDDRASRRRLAGYRQAERRSSSPIWSTFSPARRSGCRLAFRWSPSRPDKHWRGRRLLLIDHFLRALTGTLVLEPSPGIGPARRFVGLRGIPWRLAVFVPCRCIRSGVRKCFDGGGGLLPRPDAGLSSRSRTLALDSWHGIRTWWKPTGRSDSRTPAAKSVAKAEFCFLDGIPVSGWDRDVRLWKLSAPPWRIPSLGLSQGGYR